MQELIQAIRQLDEDEIVIKVNHPNMVYITSYDVYEALPTYLQQKVDKVIELCEQYLTNYGRVNWEAFAAIRHAGYKVTLGSEDLAVLTTMITMVAFDCM